VALNPGPFGLPGTPGPFGLPGTGARHAAVLARPVCKITGKPANLSLQLTYVTDWKTLYLPMYAGFRIVESRSHR